MDVLWKLFSQTYVGTKSSCRWCHNLLRGCPCHVLFIAQIHYPADFARVRCRRWNIVPGTGTASSCEIRRLLKTQTLST